MERSVSIAILFIDVQFVNGTVNKEGDKEFQFFRFVKSHIAMKRGLSL